MNNLNWALSGWDQNATLPHYRFSVVSVTPNTVEVEATDPELEKLAVRLRESGFSLAYTQNGFEAASRGLTIRAFRVTAKGQR